MIYVYASLLLIDNSVCLYPIHILRSLTCLVTIILACGSVTENKSNYAFRSMDTSE